jgi:hypothetical protein
VDGNTALNLDRSKACAEGFGVRDIRNAPKSCVTSATSVSISAARHPDAGDGWQTSALNRDTRFCRIVRRTVRGREHWHVQLIQEGRSAVPERHAFARAANAGTAMCFDSGPSTVAFVGKSDALLAPWRPWLPCRKPVFAC